MVCYCQPYFSKSTRLKIDRNNQQVKLKTQEILTLEGQSRELKDKKQSIEMKVNERHQLKQTIQELQAEYTKLQRQQQVSKHNLTEGYRFEVK